MLQTDIIHDHEKEYPSQFDLISSLILLISHDRSARSLHIDLIYYFIEATTVFGIPSFKIFKINHLLDLKIFQPICVPANVDKLFNIKIRL